MAVDTGVVVTIEENGYIEALNPFPTCISPAVKALQPPPGPDCLQYPISKGEGLELSIF